MSDDTTDELEPLQAPAPGPGLVPLASAAIMENIHSPAGRVGSHLEKSSYRSSSFVPGQVETIDVTLPLPTGSRGLDQQLSFPAHSVIVDNPTTQWIFIQSAQRFAIPGLHNAVWQIPKAATKAEMQVRAPAGVAQVALGAATQVTLTFCEAFLMPTPGVVIPNVGNIAAGSLQGTVRIQDGFGGTTNLLSLMSIPDNVDGRTPTWLGIATLAFQSLFNNVSSDRARSASAANLIAQSGLGVALAAPPGMWSIVHTPAAGAQATITRAAGAAGVRHVAWGIIISFGAIAVVVATQLQWNLRDGASGAGTILASGQVAAQAAASPTVIIPLSGLNIPGTAATPMTLEFSAALAAFIEGVTLLGYDVS